MTMENASLLYRPQLWFPRYASAKRPGGIVPASPRTESNRRRIREGLRQARTYTGRLPAPLADCILYLRGLGGMTGFVGEGGKMDAAFGPMGSGPNWANLSGFWKFDNDLTDASGNGHDLTDGNPPNAITYVTGKIGSGQAANLKNNYSSGYCAVGSGSNLQLGTSVDWAVGGWFFPQNGNNCTIAGQYDYPYLNVAWNIRGFTGGDYFFGLSTDGTNFTNVDAMAVRAWCFLVMGFDHTAGKKYYSLNGAAQTQVSASGAPSQTSLFSFGVDEEGTGYRAPSAYYDGWFFFKGRVLTDADIAWLYNSGNGRDYS